MYKTTPLWKRFQLYISYNTRGNDKACNPHFLGRATLSSSFLGATLTLKPLEEPLRFDLKYQENAWIKQEILTTKPYMK